MSTRRSRQTLCMFMLLYWCCCVLYYTRLSRRSINFVTKKIGFFRMKETHFIVLLKSFCAVKLGAEIIQQRQQQLLLQQQQNTESTASAASAFSALLPQEIIERPAITAKDKNNFFIFVFRLNNKTIFCASKTLQRYDLFWFLQTIFGFFLMEKCCKTHFLRRL